MLILALILSGLLFVAVNVAARTSRRPVIVVSVVGLFAGLMFRDLPPVMLFGVLLLFVGVVWKLSGWGPGRYAGLSVAALLLAFLITGASAVEYQVEYARLRNQFPYETMEGQVPAPPAESPSFDATRLDAVESELAESGSVRSFLLKRLHEGQVRLFINSPGFGAMRIVRPSERGVTSGLRSEPSPIQPSVPTYPEGRMPLSPSQNELEGLHSSSVLDFIHPQGFGYVKDRQHVAGFQSHRFSKVPESREVEVARLELVSLLMHKEPGVYLSDRLPQMDALKGVPTRPLDTFETEGLAALRKGEDLFVREDRMLGAIRSVKQCIACHGGERGQLLGAFTYTLRPAAK